MNVRPGLINAQGSDSCQCMPDFQLQSDNKSYLHIDECMIGNTNCSQFTTCSNQINTYKSS